MFPKPTYDSPQYGLDRLTGVKFDLKPYSGLHLPVNLLNKMENLLTSSRELRWAERLIFPLTLAAYRLHIKSKFLAIIFFTTVTMPLTWSGAETKTVKLEPSSAVPSKDYQLWIEPNKAAIEKVRKVLMTPYTLGHGNYGYLPSIGMVAGGNIEPSPAVGAGAGYNHCAVIFDNNMEGGYSLDYFNSQAGVTTSIYSTCRKYLAMSWEGVGSNARPFKMYKYPSSFPLLDRRETQYGSASPYYARMKGGLGIGGIGFPQGSSVGGQTWFLPGYDVPNGDINHPFITTVFPSEQPCGIKSGLEKLSFVIDLLYIQGNPQWKTAYRNAMNQYPFPAPRQALHFVQCTRATAAWKDPTLILNGMTSTQMLAATITKLLSPHNSGGAIGNHGGLSQKWGAGGDQTPEPNMQLMIALDPRMPTWFNN